MAAAGIGSRRHCEELILAGRVEVDRHVVRKLGTRVDREQQEIRVDGEPLKSTRLSYYLVNKPIGVVSTNFDPSGRPRVIDLLPPTKERLFTVGRLDLSSEGLMLVTNDGELANRLSHPRYGVEKTYHALVAGKPEPEVLESLRRGVHLAEGVARVVSVKVKNEIKQSTLLEIVLAEGRNREIRRILAKVGHKVLRLKRVAVGSLRLKDLAPGEWRPLGRDEVESLRRKSGPQRGARRSDAKR
jgi:23S rRNA pseudouridine2605 synthase